MVNIRSQLIEVCLLCYQNINSEIQRQKITLKASAFDEKQTLWNFSCLKKTIKGQYLFDYLSTWLILICSLHRIMLKGLLVRNLMTNGNSTKISQTIPPQQIEATCWLIRVLGWSLPNLSYQIIPYRRAITKNVNKVLKKNFDGNFFLI